MPSFRVTNTPVDFQVNGATVRNEGPATLYYRDESPVTSTLNDGSLAPAGTVVLPGTQWFATAAGAAYVDVYDPETSVGTVQQAYMDNSAGAFTEGGGFDSSLMNFEVPGLSGQLWFPFDRFIISLPDDWAEFVPPDPSRTIFPNGYLHLLKPGAYRVSLTVGDNPGGSNMADVVAQIRPVEVFAVFGDTYGESSFITEDAHGSYFTVNGQFNDGIPMITCHNVYTTSGGLNDGWAISGLYNNRNIAPATISTVVMTVIPLVWGEIRWS